VLAEKDERNAEVEVLPWSALFWKVMVGLSLLMIELTCLLDFRSNKDKVVRSKVQQDRRWMTSMERMLPS